MASNRRIDPDGSLWIKQPHVRIAHSLPVNTPVWFSTICGHIETGRVIDNDGLDVKVLYDTGEEGWVNLVRFIP